MTPVKLTSTHFDDHHRPPPLASGFADTPLFTQENSPMKKLMTAAGLSLFAMLANTAQAAEPKKEEPAKAAAAKPADKAASDAAKTDTAKKAAPAKKEKKKGGC